MSLKVITPTNHFEFPSFFTFFPLRDFPILFTAFGVDLLLFQSLLAFEC